MVFHWLINLCLNVSLICFLSVSNLFLIYFDVFTRIFMVFTSNLEFLSRCRDGQQDFETCQLSNAENYIKDIIVISKFCQNSAFFY